MENLDLTNYIQQARRSGMGDNKIREGLLQAGWPVSSVEEAMISKENPKSEVLNSKQSLKIQNSKTLIRSAIFVILVLGIAVVGYFGGAYYMSKFQSLPLWPFEVSVPVPIFTPRPTNLEVQLPNDISSWLTYRNEEYGFEFKYPREFVESKENYQLVTLNSQQRGRIEVIYSNKKLDPNNIEGIYGPIKDAIQVNVGNKIGYQYFDGEICFNQNIRVALSIESNLLIAFTSCENNANPMTEEFISEILSTFRFTR